MRTNSGAGARHGLKPGRSVLQTHLRRIHKRYDLHTTTRLSYEDLSKKYGVLIKEELRLAGIVHRGRASVSPDAVAELHTTGSSNVSSCEPVLSVHAFPAPSSRVDDREIMLFIGKPMGRSIMISKLMTTLSSIFCRMRGDLP